jgi:hypothetical protein
VAEVVYGSGAFATTEQRAIYVMARIQILTLPSKTVGEHAEYPFAIVIDEVEVTAEVKAYEGTAIRHTVEPVDVEAIKAATGAVGVVVHTGTLDVA